jgi:lipoate-protein ligase A
MTFRLLSTGAGTGAWNMQRDEQLAADLPGGLPVLRLYQWSPPAVSLGRHQPLEDLDVERLAADGIDVVRRPTGGRAILHWNELTYCAVVPLEGRSLREVYLFLNLGIVTGLRALGVDAELTSAESDFRAAYEHPSAIPCFATSARNEIHARGRKLVGSAQRRYGGTVLQHGSILLGPEHLKITDYLALSDEGARAQLRRSFEASTICLRDLLGGPVAADDVAAAVCQGLRTACGISFRAEHAELTPTLS